MKMSKPVIVTDYDPVWPTWFQQLREHVGGKLGDLALAIKHVGSTSVPGLAAKPIIDLNVVIRRSDFPRVVTLLAELGYDHEGDRGILDRESFRIRDPELKEALPRHHLYVCPDDSSELKRHVVFRDFLRANADYVARYAAVKQKMARAHPRDIEAYMAGKHAIIQEILDTAAKTEDRSEDQASS